MYEAEKFTRLRATTWEIMSCEPTASRNHVGTSRCWIPSKSPSVPAGELFEICHPCGPLSFAVLKSMSFSKYTMCFLFLLSLSEMHFSLMHSLLILNSPRLQSILQFTHYFFLEVFFLPQPGLDIPSSCSMTPIFVPKYLLIKNEVQSSNIS